MGEAEAEITLAWGMWVDELFCRKVALIARRLRVDPSDLMACMAFETGEKFSPSVRNAAGSGATGLIQFMPSTAKGLGTTTDALARMDALLQLDFVEQYFQPYVGRMTSLEDLYMAILWPAAVGKPDGHVLFAKSDTAWKRYFQNRGLDVNKDGVITKAEAAAKVRKKLEKGLDAGRARTMKI